MKTSLNITLPVQLLLHVNCSYKFFPIDEEVESEGDEAGQKKCDRDQERAHKIFARGHIGVKIFVLDIFLLYMILSRL